MHQLPDIKVFNYIEEGDFFVTTKAYQTIAEQLELTEWNSIVWIGRLFCMDNDYGEHWFDNWELREEKAEIAQKLGFDEDEIFVIDPKRFQDGKDGPCHTDDFRKTFWTDVLKNLSLNLETLIKKVKSDEGSAKNGEDKELGIIKLPLSDRVNQVLKPYGKRFQDLFPGHDQADTLFTDAQIQELSDDLSMGMKCYIHKKTLKIIVTPDFDEYGHGDELYEEEERIVEEEWMDLEEIEKMPSREAFQVMADFTETVENRHLKGELLNALEKRGPFRYFKYVVEGSAVREEWFKYREARYFEWTLRQVRSVELEIRQGNEEKE